jgi:hypothetical protein
MAAVGSAAAATTHRPAAASPAAEHRNDDALSALSLTEATGEWAHSEDR